MRGDFIFKWKGDKEKFENLIYNWTYNSGWEMNDFSKFLYLLGFQTPIEIIEVCRDNSFKLSNNTTIQLIKDMACHSHDIKVCNKNETNIFSGNINFSRKNDTIPNVVLKERSIEKENSRKRFNFLYLYDCFQKYISSHHKIILDYDDAFFINIINRQISVDNEPLALRNREAVENFLLNIDKSISVDEIYDNLIKIMDLSNQEIISFDKIEIYHMHNDTCIENFSIEDGCCTTFCKGPFCWYKDKQSIYNSDTSSVCFTNDNFYTVSVKGSREEVKKMNIEIIIKKAEKQISQLQKEVISKYSYL